MFLNATEYLLLDGFFLSEARLIDFFILDYFLGKGYIWSIMWIIVP